MRRSRPPIALHFLPTHIVREFPSSEQITLVCEIRLPLGLPEPPLPSTFFE